MNSRIPDPSKPVIAILTTSDRVKQFRGNRNNFRDIIRTGREMGFLVYVVTTRDLKLEERTVNGYVPSPSGKLWYSIPVPLPQVIYNRISNREEEEKAPVARKIAECLGHDHIKLYNPSFFNKWDLFEWLKASRATSKHVPKTRRLRSANTLIAMLSTHDSLYLKPESGKAGKGIMRLKYREDVSLPYRLQIQSGKRTRPTKRPPWTACGHGSARRKNNPVILCSRPFSSQHTTGGLLICGCSCKRIAGEPGQ